MVWSNTINYRNDSFSFATAKKVLLLMILDMEPPSHPMKITVSPPSASSLSSQRNEKAALTNSDAAETKKLASTEASSRETETRREKLMVTFPTS